MGLLGRVKSCLPERWRTRLARWRRPRSLYLLFSPSTGPLSHYAGRERANPIDRYYVETFPEAQLDIKSWGNARAGMAFWIGLAQEDVPRRQLMEHDPAFPVIVTVRATKPGG